MIDFFIGWCSSPSASGIFDLAVIVACGLTAGWLGHVL